MFTGPLGRRGIPFQQCTLPAPPKLGVVATSVSDHFAGLEPPFALDHLRRRAVGIMFVREDPVLVDGAPQQALLLLLVTSGRMSYPMTQGMGT